MVGGGGEGMWSSSWMGFDGCEVGIDAVMVLMILSSNSEHKKGQFGKENGLCREGCWFICCL